MTAHLDKARSLRFAADELEHAHRRGDEVGVPWWWLRDKADALMAAHLNCPTCGSGEDGDCICAAAEAIAKVKWEADGRAVYEAPWEQLSRLKRQSLIIKALPEAG